MNLQVIVSTMNQSDYSLLEKMNIQSDAVIINQCDKNDVAEFDFKGYKIKWISMTERGVGLSRNTGILHSTADIVLFADDDITYCDGYVQGVLGAFEKNEAADVVCFNINLVNSNKNIGGHRNNTENKKLNVFNSMRYGACLIAARRKVLLRERIMFSLLFGGGAEFMSGEDSIFIKDCFEAGLKLYADVFCLGDVDDSKSSWYKGINDDFFIHRGFLYYLNFPVIYPLIFAHYSLKLSKLDKNYNLFKILGLFFKGKSIKKNYR